MKRILLMCALLLTVLIYPAFAVEGAMTVVDGDGSSAFLYTVNEHTLLLGYAEYEDLVSQCPDVKVTQVVICCNHPEHVADTQQLAIQLGAEILDDQSETTLIRREAGAVIAGDLVFTSGSKIPGMMTFDCRGRYLQFRTTTRQKAVNVRKEPSTGAGKVAKLQLGTVLTVIGETVNDRGEVWYRVRLEDGDTGYIRADLLVITENMEAVAPVENESESDGMVVLPSVVVVTGDGVGAAGSGKSGGQTSSGTPAGNLGSAGAAVPEGINGYQAFFARTNDSGINVRAKPSSKAERIVQLREGIAVTVLDEVKGESGQLWYYVQLQDGRRGYIRADLLTIADSLTDIEQPSKSRRYIGNKRTMVFHRPSCHTLPKAKNQVYFSSRDYAIAKGYRPCENCDP